MDTARASLELQFLDGWSVSYNGQPLALNSRKPQALLAYLAVESDQRFSRQELLGLLWPEMSEAKARNNLRVSLARLRGALPEAIRDDSLGRSRHDLWWQPAPGEQFDVRQFRQLIARADKHKHDERATCATCRRTLLEIADLYRGEFLRGFHVEECPEFEEWQFVLRERLHLQAMEVYEDLAAGLTTEGDYAKAAAYTRRQLELDPLHDAAHRRLLRLLAYQDQRAAALAHFAELAILLSTELGVEPDAELIALMRQIEKGALEVPRSAVDTTHGRSGNRLPESLTPFIGREDELSALKKRLANPGYRLIALVGPGGMGKSRLALEAARTNQRQFRNGAVFVPLAPIDRPDLVPAAFAAALEMSLDPGLPTGEQVIDYLQPMAMLMVVDNMEHVLDSVDFLLQLLARCPHIVLLATSREPLNVQAEDLFWLGGLPAPADDELHHAGQFAAVHLFCDRAHRLMKSFRLTVDNTPAVVEICRVVEGVPLAIELVASWIRERTVEEMATAIATNLDLLQTTMRDMPPAHRSMRAVFDTSWLLLMPEDRLLLARLSIFRGGFSVDAAGQIAGANLANLTRLQLKSLLRHRGDGQYDMHELLCQFADEKLHQQEPSVTDLMAAYSHYYTELLAGEAEAFAGKEPGAAIATINRDLENVRRS